MVTSMRLDVKVLPSLPVLSVITNSLSTDQWHRVVRGLEL